MPILVTMPRLSDTMEEGTLVKWNVKVGDKVKAGDAVADVETDKATMECNVFDEGTVAKLAVGEGDAAQVGKLILVLAKPGESIEEAAKAQGDAAPAAKPAAKPAEKPAEAKPAATGKPAEVAPAPAAPASNEEAEETVVETAGGRVRISPLAQKLAGLKGLDIGRIKGSGPDGKIIKKDILAAAEAKAAAPAVPAAKPSAPAAPAPVLPSTKLESKLIPVSNMRKTIAKRLLESKTTIPHFTVTVAVNMDPLIELRGTLNKQLETQKVKLSVNDFIVRAVALALVQHPLINASWTHEGIQQHGSINVGIAVALPVDKGGGLVVPVLRDVQNKGLRTISAETRALAEKAKTKGLSVEEMSDGTFTISNLGMLGVEHFEAIINPPQAAILAVGAALPKPVVRNGAIVIGNEMTTTISADHRVIDGAMAAEYLQTLKQLLENPAVLLV